MKADKNLSPIVTELFLRGIKIIISLVFISQSYFTVLKSITLNVKQYFIMKKLHESELHQIASNRLSDIEFKDFMKLYKDYTKEPFLFQRYNLTIR